MPWAKTYVNIQWEPYNAEQFLKDFSGIHATPRNLQSMRASFKALSHEEQDKVTEVLGLPHTWYPEFYRTEPVPAKDPLLAYLDWLCEWRIKDE